MANVRDLTENLSDPGNGAEDIFTGMLPYRVKVTLMGSSDILFHKWDCEAVTEKGKAAKNSIAKKTDNVESYVYRNEKGEICIPGEYLRQTIINSARYKQDPRSPRKNAMDLYKAGIVSLTELASLGSKNWDYLCTKHVKVQRAGINRTRPAMRAGWRATFDLQILTPEYISSNDLRESIEQGGRLIGLADFRPTYGRYGIVEYKVIE